MRAPEPASLWRDRRHSTTSFSKKILVAGTSYQMLQVLSFCARS